MRNHNAGLSLLLVLLLFFSGCANVKAPSSYLEYADSKRTDVYGSWINVIMPSAKKDSITQSGELIAVSFDSIYVMNTTFTVLPINKINKAILINYDSDYREMSGLVALGSLATISNGWFLVFTLPIWVIGGTISTSNRSYEPILEFPEKSFSEFEHYSRFPNGLPANIDRNKIKLKPSYIAEIQDDKKSRTKK